MHHGSTYRATPFDRYTRARPLVSQSNFGNMPCSDKSETSIGVLLFGPKASNNHYVDVVDHSSPPPVYKIICPHISPSWSDWASARHNVSLAHAPSIAYLVQNFVNTRPHSDSVSPVTWPSHTGSVLSQRGPLSSSLTGGSPCRTDGVHRPNLIDPMARLAPGAPSRGSRTWSHVTKV